MLKLLVSTVLMLWSSSLGFKLKCQPPNPIANFLHLQDVSRDMESHVTLMKKGFLSKFDAWCKAAFSRHVALGVFTSPKELCFRIDREFLTQDIIGKYDEIRVLSSNDSARAVLNALSRAAKLDWYKKPSEAHRVIVLYTNKEPSLDSCASESIKLSAKGVIDSLLEKKIYVIFVVPRRLVYRYKSIFAPMGHNFVVARMLSTIGEMENELDLAMNELYCGIKREPICEEESIVQLLHIQDFSYSYKNDMEDLRRQLPASLRKLSTRLPEMEVALATFVDKPIRPFGYPSDYCYREDLEFTKDLSKYEEKLRSVKFRGGNDFNESQFDAIYRALKSDKLNWIHARPDGKAIYRVIVMATDSEPHVKGDANLDAAYSPKGCQYSDYPSAVEIAEMLKIKDVIPLFIVTSDVHNKWQSIMRELSAKGVLVELTETLDISNAIQEGLKKICDSQSKKGV